MKKHTLKPPDVSDYKRLLFLSLFIFALFSLLVAKFYTIQIVEGDKWSKVADRQHYFIVKEPFKRGTFLSNSAIKKGHPETPHRFVFDVMKYHLYADPLSIPPEYHHDISKALSSVLKLNAIDNRKLQDQLEKNSHSRRVAMWIDVDRKESILKWWHTYAHQHAIPRNALFFVSDYQRSYPYGKLLGQVLHTIQNVKDEVTSQATPTGGLELFFNKELKGKQGKRRLMRSPRNSLETGEVLSLPENGADIHLTINHYLQAIAEEELEKGVQKCKAKSGWAVMMDPYTGEVWALAQYPFFFPTDYQRFFNDQHLIEHTKVKAITDANEPGSIMKPLTLAIALKANEELASRNEQLIFDPDAMMDTSNPYFSGRKKPLKDTHFHKSLNMKMALQKSSNIYMARLVEKIIHRLGNHWYRNALSQCFGFSQKTGIELPSESNGVLPMPGKKHQNGTLEWSAGTPYTLSIGHNIQVTSLQILRAYAVLANGGYLVQPTLIKQIGNTPSTPSKPIRTLSQTIATTIATTLKYGTKVGGTARRADIYGYTEAGKTGTADKAINGIYRPEYVCSSFVGMTPAKNPIFILVVTVDEPEYGFEPGVGRKHHGGVCAAPIFREIAKRSLEYLGIPPDDPHGYPQGDPRYDPDKADWLPEIRKLKEEYDIYN